MKKLTITSLLFICVVSLLSAKEAAKQWSLNDCLEYAVNNNIELQQSRIMYEQSAIDENRLVPICFLRFRSVQITM